MTPGPTADSVEVNCLCASWPTHWARSLHVGVRYLITGAAPGFGLVAGFPSAGSGGRSPDKCSMPTALNCEVVLAMMLLIIIIILGLTDQRATARCLPIDIGLVLTPISVGPTRSPG